MKRAGEGWSWGWAILLAAIALPLLISVFSYGYFPVQADETNLAWVGKLIAMGRLPYRDFFSFIPPLTLYGLGAFFKAAGSSLANLRLLSISWLLLTTILCYGLCIRQGTPAKWACAAAFAIPAVYVPYWPVPSHHYLAMALGLSACLLVWSGRPATTRWLLGGALCGLSGLALQTEGVFFAGLLALKLLLDPSTDRRRSALAAVASLASPLALVALILVLNGTAGDAIRDLVLWPFRYYKQPGGFNDVHALRFLGGLLGSSWPATFSLPALAPVCLLIVALTLPVLALALASMGPLFEIRRGKKLLPALLPPSGVLLCLLLYVRGRADWVHLALWAPVFLLLAFTAIDWTKERGRPRAIKIWLVAVLLLSAVRWPLYWTRHPPSLRQVLKTDAEFRERTILPMLHSIPGLEGDGLPLLYLSPQGSGCYFFWAPDPPPVDWLLPPAARYNAPWEYERLARFMREHRIPVVVIPERYYGSFLTDPSPLRDELRRAYRPEAKTVWGIVLRRSADERHPS